MASRTADPVTARLEDFQGRAAFAGRQVAQDICAVCHGLDGNAVIEEYPDLAGQNRAYLINALIAYRENRRIGGNAGLMQPQAERLSPQQMADVAAYYASLRPDKP